MSPRECLKPGFRVFVQSWKSVEIAGHMMLLGLMRCVTIDWVIHFHISCLCSQFGFNPLKESPHGRVFQSRSSGSGGVWSVVGEVRHRASEKLQSGASFESVSSWHVSVIHHVQNPGSYCEMMQVIKSSEDHFVWNLTCSNTIKESNLESTCTPNLRQCRAHQAGSIMSTCWHPDEGKNHKLQRRKQSG